MNYTEQQLTAAVVSGGLRPALVCLDTGIPASILSLIQKCWDANPEIRPSFSEIVAELEVILEKINSVNKEDLVPDKSSIQDDKIIKRVNNVECYQEIINWSAQGEHAAKSYSDEMGSNVKIWTESVNDCLTYYPVVTWGSFATCGKRETMEDTHFLMPQMCSEKDIHVFGIFDGHRGMVNFILCF